MAAWLSVRPNYSSHHAPSAALARLVRHAGPVLGHRPRVGQKRDFGPEGESGSGYPGLSAPPGRRCSRPLALRPPTGLGTGGAPGACLFCPAPVTLAPTWSSRDCQTSGWLGPAFASRGLGLARWSQGDAEARVASLPARSACPLGGVQASEAPRTRCPQPTWHQPRPPRTLLCCIV